MYMSTNIQQVLAVQEVKILLLVMYIQYTTTNQLDSKGLRIEPLRQARKSKNLLAVNVIDYCKKCRPKGPLIMLVTLKKFSSQSNYSWFQFPIPCYIYVIYSDIDYAYCLVG